MPFRVPQAAVAAALSIAVAGAVTFHTVRTLGDTMGWVAHTHEVIASVDAMLGSVTTAESATRAYMLTHDERLLAEFAPARDESLERFRQLQQLTRDNPAQQERLHTLSALLAERFELLQGAVDAGGTARTTLVQRGAQRMQEIHAQVNELRH